MTIGTLIALFIVFVGGLIFGRRAAPPPPPPPYQPPEDIERGNDEEPADDLANDWDNVGRYGGNG